MTTAANFPTLQTESIEKETQESLRIFTTLHQTYQRPIALVTSGGTATDLEVHSVRFLDNFSTGHRGAVSVEEFLRLGYAVIHLWRIGSTSPYARILSKILGCQSGNHGLGFASLGRLFHGQCDGVDDIPKFDSESKATTYDPWLTDTESSTLQEGSRNKSVKLRKKSSSIQLHRHISNDTELQKMLRERSSVIEEGRLLTLPFRTVEEYIAMLKISSESLKKCRSLGLVYLAAAVSDFYVPQDKRSIHKISAKSDIIKSNEQSDSTKHDRVKSNSIIEPCLEDNCLTIKLYGVPKCIPRKFNRGVINLLISGRLTILHRFY